MHKTSIGNFYFVDPFIDIDDEEDCDKYFNHNKIKDDDDDTEKLTHILNVLEALYNTYYSDSDKEDSECDEDDDYDDDEKEESDIPVDKLPQKKIDFGYKKTENKNKIKITKAEALYLLGLDEDKYEII